MTRDRSNLGDSFNNTISLALDEPKFEVSGDSLPEGVQQ
jgi:hypothetical protein